MGHGARQQASRGHHRADVKRLFDPRAKKSNLVVETGFFQRARGRLHWHVATRRDRVLRQCQKTVINRYSQLTIWSSRRALHWCQECGPFGDNTLRSLPFWKAAKSASPPALQVFARLPKKSLTLVKKFAASG